MSSHYSRTTQRSFGGRASEYAKEGAARLHASGEVKQEDKNKQWDILKAKVSASLVRQTAVFSAPRNVEQVLGEASARFEMSARVKTSSGEFDLALDVGFSSSFMARRTLSPRLTDPLVISLEGTSFGLSGRKISFDIDADGELDQISALKKGQGFLALDKNQNGKIDDANELFGTKSGDGFADLAVFDDDKNGWIDSNDSVFSRLRVWENDGQKSRLLALGEVGVGAIYLGNVQTNMELRDTSNAQLLAEIKSSGFAISDEGFALYVAQVDLQKGVFSRGFSGSASSSFGFSNSGATIKNQSLIDKPEQVVNENAKKLGQSNEGKEVKPLNKDKTPNSNKQDVVKEQVLRFNFAAAKQTKHRADFARKSLLIKVPSSTPLKEQEKAQKQELLRKIALHNQKLLQSSNSAQKSSIKAQIALARMRLIQIDFKA